MTAKYQPIDLTRVEIDQRTILNVTFTELWALYIRHKPAKREDLREYRLRKWHAQIGAMPAWEVSVAHINAIIRQMDSLGYSPSSTNRDLADIRAVFNWAMRHGHCPPEFIHPTVGIEMKSVQPRRVELSHDEQLALLTASKLSHWEKMHCFVLCALVTGARKSELLNLTWPDIDWKTNRAILHDTKAGKPRRLLLNADCIAALKAIKPKSRLDDDELVFCGRNPFRAFDIRKAWVKVRDDAQLPALRIHDMRHAATARMLKAGGNLSAVAQVLGHSDHRMISKVYGHLDDQHLQQIVCESW
ncbi:MAG: site-specific integrase [Halioglobus sp.]